MKLKIKIFALVMSAVLVISAFPISIFGAKAPFDTPIDTELVSEMIPQSI